ncbi:MAG: hypothetical protein GQ570_07355 [Helicobacteraceae bacterium]|nr:hypothetical protein [Helicobacteraceae bacterium]
MSKKFINVFFSLLFLLYIILETLHLSHDHYQQLDNDAGCLVCIVEDTKTFIDPAIFIIFIPFLFVAILLLYLPIRHKNLTLKNKDPPSI